MKQIVFLLAVLTAIISFVGCTSDNGVSVISIDDEKDFSVANVKVLLEKNGELKKLLAKEDTILIGLGSGTKISGGLIRIDTLLVSSASIQYLLKRNGQYWIEAIREGDEFTMNSGSLDFTVPDADTFDINIDAKSLSTKMTMSFSIEGADICSLIVKRILVPTGGASPFFLEDKMYVAGQSSVSFSGYLRVDYAWDIYVEGKSCATEAFASGTIRTSVLESGKDYSGLSLDLVWHDGTKVIAKVLIKMKPPGDIPITVSVPAQPAI